MSRGPAARAGESSAAAKASAGRCAVAASLAVLLFALAVVALSTLVFGSVSGHEFSPDTFRRRSYFYYEIPFFRWQAWPITRRDDTGELEQFLAKKPLLRTIHPAQPRWDLVQSVRSTGRVRVGDAAILCTYFDARDADGNLYWLNWTKRQPRLSQELWPAIADVARDGLYVLVPDLIRLAKETRDPVQLHRRLVDELAAQYGWVAQVRQRLADHDAAIRFFTAAIRRAPTRADLLRGRAESLKATGESRKSGRGLGQRPTAGP